VRGSGRTSRRLAGVDVARGLALLGMAAVHIFPEASGDGSLHPAYVVAAGRAAALFAVLAGVGLALLTGSRIGASLRRVRLAVAVRAVLLLALGLALGSVDSPPLVILQYYALLFLVAVPLLGLPARLLAPLAAAWAVLSPLASQLLRSTVVDPFPVAEPGGAGLPVQLAVSGVYPVLTWTTYLLAGLAVGRLALRRPSVAVGLLLAGSALALGARVLSSALLSAAGGAAELARQTPELGRSGVDRALEGGLFGVTPTTDERWLLVASPHSGTTLDLVGTTGSSLAVLGLCLLLTVRGAGPLFPLACAGSMTLTLYFAHVLALRTGGPLLLDDRTDLWLLHVAAALVAATLWRPLVGRGPLEAATTWVSRRVAAATVRR
jgi:uncharacterized membrane protein